jgi:hypothetical protein
MGEESMAIVQAMIDVINKKIEVRVGTQFWNLKNCSELSFDKVLRTRSSY